jgi:steroid delta-isomerase-like uncharacterized protein
MSEFNKSIVRRVFDECLNAHDLASYPELHSNVIYHAPALGRLRTGAHRDFLLSLFAGLPDASWTIEDQLADDDKVVTRWSVVGTHLGIFLGASATDNPVMMEGISVHRLVNGKIVEQWDEWDTLGMMRQLGVIAPEATIGDMVAP